MSGFCRVAVGISGGVDSAVTALLLKMRGLDVRGVFMNNWDGSDELGHCTSLHDLEDARYVCNKLNIPLRQVNFVKEYWMEVFQYMLAEYQAGFTPNPDIMCNKRIKFDLLWKYVKKEMGADVLATGHYAGSSFGPYLENYDPTKSARLLKPKDAFKDQTFFLSQIPQESLNRVMFPLADLTKDQVKKLAVKYGLCKIAKKKESMGICFIGSRNFQNFMSEYIDMKAGRFVNIETGQVVGMHQGIHLWTLGQGCRIGGYNEPFYVASKDIHTNDIYVAPGSKHPALYTDIVFTEPLHGVVETFTDYDVVECEFRFQHTKPLVRCRVANISSDCTVILLERPLKAITPGQYAVLYKEDECLGSARILRPGPSYFTRKLAIDSDYLEYVRSS